MTEIVFRKMVEADIDHVVSVENASFSSPWARQSFCEELENQLAYYLLATSGDAVIGYVGMWIIIDEAHITNVAVLPSHRRLGIGEAMMQEALVVAKSKGACAMTLEVRASNLAAKNLYEKLGFESSGVRKNYYEDTQEDAIIMWLRDINK
ncbi:ribosomal protein S18-alanine N-acetyltransferase [Anaerosinus massiliensis]|uniref:ribosomal protein S18-alanine N-acetyltransferase n=1 Tax=Massilibacillus massiliensis TaxID=1806837 RepID=UPI000B1CCABB|nr:ribosomal protein S18-alanine N-acetyltransferase [Massilibacillus massiliensis]